MFRSAARRSGAEQNTVSYQTRKEIKVEKMTDRCGEEI